MNVRLSLTLLLSLALLPASALALPCRAGDSTGVRVIEYVKELVSSSEPTSVGLRTGLGLSGVDSADVQFVTDSIVCRHIRHAVDSIVANRVPMEGEPVIVRAGPRYVVFPLFVSDLPGRAVWLFDLSFVFQDMVAVW